MAAINAALSFVILALNILDAFKALKPSRSSKSSSSIDSNPLSELGQSTSTSIKVVRSPMDGTPTKSKEQRQRIGSAERRAGLRAQLLILLVWVCWRRMETILDQTLGWILPFYETFKTVFLLWLLASRSIGSSQIFYNVVLPFVKPYESLLDSIFIQSSNFSSLLIFLISLPIARLTASFKNDNWFGWVRGWSWRSIFGSSNLEPVSSSSNSRKSGGNGDGDGSGGSSIRAVNGNTGGSRRTPVGRVLESRIESQAQPRKRSTLQAPTKLRTVSSSANLNNRISKSNPTSQAERKRTTSLTNPTAVVEKLRSIPAPPTGFGPSTSSQTQVPRNIEERNNGMKTYAFIPGQTPPRRGVLEPPLQVPTSVAGLTSPHPPGAFGSNLDPFSNTQNAGPSSSKEPFMPVSRAPFKIFAEPVDESESASASTSTPKNTENGIERNHQGEDVEMESSSSKNVKGSLPKSTSSSSNKKTSNSNLNSKTKIVSSRSSTLRAKGAVKGSSVQSKIPNQKGEESNVNGHSQQSANGQKKKTIPKSSSTRTLRSRSVTPSDAESQEDEEKEAGEEDDGSSSDQMSKDDDDQLTPRKRKATTISSPSKRLRSRNGKVSDLQSVKDSDTKSRDVKGKGKAVDSNGKTSGTVGSSSKVGNAASTASKASAPSTRASKKDSVISEREEGGRGVSEGRGRGRTQRGTTRGRGRGNLRGKV